MGTVIISCDCRHSFQDERYGAGRRVANLKAKKEKEDREARCTVCSRVQKVKVA
ncbi:MAG: hypothetical protein AB1631_03640 [Acidobacteriota bacterium]